MTLLEYQNIKTFFAKGYAPNWSEEVCRKQTKKEFRVEKVIKQKEINYTLVYR